MASIEDIIAAEQKRMETVLRAAYDAGREAARTEMLSMLAGDHATYGSSSNPSPSGERKRAPKGLPRKLVSRVLFDNDIIGTTPQDIVDAAISDDEKMIAISTVRSELRNGEKLGIYTAKNGYWSLSPAAYSAFERTGKPDLPKKEEALEASSLPVTRAPG